MNKIFTLFFIIFSLNIFSQDNSASKIDSLKQILVKPDTKNIDKINSYLALTRIFLRKDLDSAIIYAEKGKLLAQKDSKVKMIAICLIELARIKEVENEIEESIAYLKEAANLYKGLNKDNTYLKVCNYQGMYYEILSNYDMSIEKYLLGLKFAINLNNRMYEAVFLTNLSIVYARANQLDKSLASILEAISIYNEIGSENQYFQALIYVGGSYKKLEKYDLAKENLNKAKSFFTIKNNHILLADIYANLGEISLIEESQEEALELLLIAQSHALIMRDYNGEQNYKFALINNSLGNTYLYFKEYLQAIRAFKLSQETGERIKSGELLKESYKGLYSSYLGLKKLDSVRYYLDLFIPINDSLIAEKYNEKIDALNYEYQLDIEKSNFEKEIAVTEFSKNRQFLFFSILALLLITGIIILAFIGYFQKNKVIKSKIKNTNLVLNQENLTLKLEKTKRELTTSVLKLVERNEFISNLAKDLNSLDFNEVQSQQLKSIIKRSTINDSKKLWKEFELVYVQNNKSFFKKLTEIAPNISSNEIRLIALIKLNFSTKEISTITYQNAQSIKVARYRLRKKLGIDKNKNLSSFLNSL